LLFGALGVVVQLKESLNVIWDVGSQSAGGLWSFVRTYVISLAAVIALGFMLLVSLVVTAALAAIGKYWAPQLPEAALHVANFLVSFAFISLLFATMFKWLPDAEIGWRDVWLGGMVTTVLFDVGKFLIGLYVGKLGLESTYSGAASIVILLIWVYYSAQIVLLGAEFTHVQATYRSHALAATDQP
jgi:membrane protein